MHIQLTQLPKMHLADNRDGIRPEQQKVNMQIVSRDENSEPHLVTSRIHGLHNARSRALQSSLFETKTRREFVIHAVYLLLASRSDVSAHTYRCFDLSPGKQRVD